MGPCRVFKYYKNIYRTDFRHDFELLSWTR